jgi:hypothetical protein
VNSIIEQLTRELSALQARRGIQHPGRADAVGPALTKALDLDQCEPGESRRRALVTGLLRHAESLPPDLHMVFLSGCSIRTEDRPTLTQRVTRAATTMQVAERTAWARLADANRRVAESLAGPLPKDPSAPPPEWLLTSLHAYTDLRSGRPITRSTHTIRVVSPYLTHITERISFPGASPDADPAFRAWGDAELVSVERPYQVTWQVSLRLKRTFLAGESATYSFQSQAPSRRLLHPMSVMLPERVCRVFSTEVNFGSPSVATRVWRLDGVPAPVAELDTPSGVLLDPHTQPVLKASYDDMTLGRVYGLRWEWSDDA